MTRNEPPRTSHARQWLSQASTSLLLKVGLLLLGTAAIVFVLAWFLFGDGLSLISGLERPVSAADPVAYLAQPGPVEIEVDGVKLDVVHRPDPPAMIEIDGFQFEVANRYLTANEMWQSRELPANQVFWLERSIVNYVFRVPGSRSYREILETAGAANGTIRLTTDQGNELAFTISEAGELSQSARTRTLQQTRPVITLLWLAENGEGVSYFVSGEYAPSNQALQAAGFDDQSAMDRAAGAPAVDLAVRLAGIDLQADGLQLLVRGTVTNRSPGARIIEPTDIHLATDDLVSQILSVDPPLPWQLAPNNSQMAFAVTFQRPPDANAVLTIGPQQYALSFSE